MDQTDISLHQATHSDIDLIVDMRILFSDELVGKQDIAAEREMRAHLHGYYAAELNTTCLCWYAMAAGEIVSIVNLVLRRQPGNIKNPSGKWGYIMNVFTLPAYRRRGISSQLLDKIMDHAIGLGYTAFELHATKAGEPMYLQNGFVAHGEPTYRKYFAKGQ